jgi:ATP-dependent DNA helicase RecQ
MRRRVGPGMTVEAEPEARTERSAASPAAVRRAAKDVFGWESLRAGQADAIGAVLAGRDHLAIMPTGYGKSAIYQVAGLFLPGLTVVVSPLIALQTDQVASIGAYVNAPPAFAVNSEHGKRETDQAWEAVRQDGRAYLFLAPEQLANDDAVQRLRSLGVGLFVVDEAHCVSAWGHDFRPDYLRLGEVIERLGHPPVLALTATGSPPVRDEILHRLRMRDAAVATHGFDRPNLTLDVVRHEEDRGKREAVLEQVAAETKPGLLYVATRRDTTRFADELLARGIRAAGYHGGLPASARRAVHEAFQADELDVVVATSAFGMGIDKANVRFVVHAASTDSLDSYYQEIGRAGRDGEPANATLHYRDKDLGLRSFFASGSIDRTALGRTVRTLGESDRPLRMAELGRASDLSTRSVARIVNLLERAGIVTSTRRGIRLVHPIEEDEAGARASEAQEEQERIDRSRIAMARGYAETTQCRRQFLLGYFGERLAEPCGNCDTCAGGSAYEHAEDAPDQDAFPLESNVTHREWGPGIVIRTENDRITVFFESQGYKVLSRRLLEESDLLKPGIEDDTSTASPPSPHPRPAHGS